MILKPDLHIHTSCSDGLVAPENIAVKALEKGVNLIAVTDHDTVIGLKNIKHVPQVQVIHGVELSSTFAGAQVHILGFGVKKDSSHLVQYLEELKLERVDRFKKMIAHLRGVGVVLEPEDFEGKTQAPGRMHLARALVKKGYASDTRSAFDRYLVKGRTGFVQAKPRLPSDVIRILCQDGIVPILAHPGRIGLSDRELGIILDVWQAAGLMGIEVFHRANAPFKSLEHTARQRRLLVTGGSDYHGDAGHPDIGEMLSLWSSHNEDAHRLLQVLSA